MARVIGPSFRSRIAELVVEMHDDVTRFFTELDGRGEFREDRWERPGGGGGVSRVLTDGGAFEKAGVNRSIVEGTLPAGAAQRFGSRMAPEGETGFFAAGVSLVVHPASPMVPTVHLNVRYLEIIGPGGETLDAWFGGGTDLTPTYPHPEDAAHFHRTLKALCERTHPAWYGRFKTWCDHYFVNPHRGDERRGIGGIFFDHLRPGESDVDVAGIVRFWLEVGRSLPAAYGPIVGRRRGESWGERERRFQLFRRGRYVEFNLVHDRGTLFGLQTGARIESVLMSLPPLAAWPYAPEWPAGSFEAKLMAMLEPRDWAAEPAGEAGAR
ncbi:MAG TPA: oxygen-dependent coproporphyrinogen oxidase [Gemmatimonadales bacterium]|nr:oxygen-dependent coproporphyrinogen oxidase [Gemmatimonadales bacterium]